MSYRTLLVLTACVGWLRSDLGAQQQYLRIQTNRASTLKKELSDAAAKGYRVRAGAGCCSMILERITQPPDVYEYLFIDKADHLIDYDSEKAKAFVQKQLIDAGSKGFRVVPQVIATLEVHNYGQVILMEKPPGPVQPWEYKIGSPQSNCEDGFRAARIIWSGSDFRTNNPLGSPHGIVALLERPVGRAADAGHIQTQFVQDEEILPVESKLGKLAPQGYRVIESADSELNLLLEKSPDVTERFEYSVIGAAKSGEFEQELNQAGESGYRLVPRAIGSYDKPIQKRIRIMGVQVDAFAVMERASGVQERFDYIVTSDPQKLPELARQGFEPVAMQDFGDKAGAVILERRRQR